MPFYQVLCLLPALAIGIFRRVIPLLGSDRSPIQMGKIFGTVEELRHGMASGSPLNPNFN